MLKLGWLFQVAHIDITRSGSGYITAFLSNMIKSQTSISPIFLCTDINSFATKATQGTFEKNCVFGDIVKMDLLKGFHKRLKNKVDILMFNPPYVPTEKDELGWDDIRAAYAGGVNGREVLDRLLPDVQVFLRVEAYW